MRLIDADSLPVSKQGKIEIVLMEDIRKARVFPSRPLAPKKTIDIKWLQQKMMDAIVDREMDSKYFGIINTFIAEYERMQDADK